MSYEERIRKERSGFSKSFARLANYLLENYFEAAFLTANELAQVVDVDPATVVRFAQHLHYSGYPELQQHIRARVRRESIPDSENPVPFAPIRSALDQTERAWQPDCLSRFVEAVGAAQKVIILFETSSEWLAGELCRGMQLLDIDCRLSELQPERLALTFDQLQAGAVLVVYALTDSTPILIRSLEIAHARQISTFVIAGSAADPSTDAAMQTIAIHGAFDALTRLACAAAISHKLLQAIQESFPADKASENLVRIAALTDQLRVLSDLVI